MNALHLGTGWVLDRPEHGWPAHLRCCCFQPVLQSTAGERYWHCHITIKSGSLHSKQKCQSHRVLLPLPFPFRSVYHSLSKDWLRHILPLPEWLQGKRLVVIRAGSHWLIWTPCVSPVRAINWFLFSVSITVRRTRSHRFITPYQIFFRQCYQ